MLPLFCIASICETLTITMPCLPDEAKLLSLNWRRVKKLICCLISKLPSPVSGPDPVQAVVNFNHSRSWSWVIAPGLSIPEGQLVTAINASRASPNCIVRRTFLCVCVCVCAVNWNQAHVWWHQGRDILTARRGSQCTMA